MRVLPPLLLGVAATAGIALASAAATGPEMIAAIARRADAARDRAGGQGIGISFTTAQGWLTRHPALSGGVTLDNVVRARSAAAIAGAGGVGAVHWRSKGRAGSAGGADTPAQAPLHCQEDVEAILKARTIRFSEASALIDPASEQLLDEVAGALKPCLGSIIAIVGHTDGNGDPGANLALSWGRADAVRWALIGRGIPADGLRATGVGSREPIAKLDARDPANRRIDFSVIATMPIRPTPVDTPGPG